MVYSFGDFELDDDRYILRRASEALKGRAQGVRGPRLSPSPSGPVCFKVLPDKPSTAGLLFVNLSGDPAPEYLNDAITEALIPSLRISFFTAEQLIERIVRILLLKGGEACFGLGVFARAAQSFDLGEPLFRGEQFLLPRRRLW